MSLVGSLEDLGLGDILQIINLSRKSGVLMLRADAGEGHVIFEDGLIRGAAVRGQPESLRELLAKLQVVGDEVLAVAWQDARNRAVPLAQVLGERELVDAERLDGLRRDRIESAVLEMFSWPSGEFSFEIRELRAEGADELFVSPGINPQFLALEGSRREDEGLEDEIDEPVFDGEEDYAAPAPQVELLAAAEVHTEPDVLDSTPLPEQDGAIVTAEPLPAHEEPLVAQPLSEEHATVVAEPLDAGVEPATPAELEPALAAEPAIPAEPLADAVTVQPAAEARVEEATPVPAEPPPPAPVEAPPVPVVVIDSELPVLEWMKRALGDQLTPMHIFQHSDLGITRIRQYLARAQVPTVVIAANAPPDPISGARDSWEIIARLKRQSARMQVGLLLEVDEEPPKIRRGATPPDFLVRKPTPSQLADSRCQEERDRCARVLLETLVTVQRAGGMGSGGGQDVSRLRDVSEKISDPSSAGEVLSQVLEFASQTFRRIAMFMVRDESAWGLAQVGLPRAGGPDDAGIRDIALPSRDSAWFRAVLESRKPVRCAPSNDGDRNLAILLGSEIPSQAYVAPIASGEHVVALLYADNLPTSEPLGDATSLEVVLHGAGMALDRAALERALAEAED